MTHANVLIAGGGIVGSAVAWQLAQRGVSDVVVVDLDLAGLYASSELNAGGARATWWQPVNIATCAATLDFFREHAETFGFRECGYLWLFDDPALLERAASHAALQNAFGLGVELLDPGSAFERFPFLDRGREEIVGATFSPRDGLLNPNAVRRFYREQAESCGVRFFNRHYVAGVETETVAGPSGGGRRVVAVDVHELREVDATDESGALREILTSHRVPPRHLARESRVACDAIVNCLGAWSSIFSAKVGVSDVTEPVRRQIALVDPQPEGPGADAIAESLAGAGMIVDPSNLYFHPEGGHVLAGYSTPEEPPGFGFAYDGVDFFEAELWPRLAHRSSAFERCGHVRGWSGLYAVTPDRSGIAGPVEGVSNLFDAHSFTGRGVMQSYGVARAVAEMIDTGRIDPERLAPLSRDRFRDEARWIVEDLHI
jgi:sarcosine oxidase subunit beta